MPWYGCGVWYASTATELITEPPRSLGTDIEMTPPSAGQHAVAHAVPEEVSSPSNSERLADFDFLDLGASKGMMIDFAKRELGGTRGMGIDINAAKVEVMQQRGYDCLLADATRMEFPSDSVRFVTMCHFLEHLPNYAAIERSIQCAASVATDFIYIQGPYFDADRYLHDRALKYFWSDWSGHTCHLTTDFLGALLDGNGLSDYVMLGRKPVEDSSHPSILPLDAPIDQHEYDPDIHSPKSLVAFDASLYMEIICVVALRPLENWNEIVTAPTDCHLIRGTLPYG
ncbi:MAG: class I SAM-dependent methyltransferase [Gammaproteobacteria bacterium]|nr:class I SAM-dependent methyltransferase [Gammaproteobacteria bacterium]